MKNIKPTFIYIHSYKIKRNCFLTDTITEGLINEPICKLCIRWVFGESILKKIVPVLQNNFERKYHFITGISKT